MQSFMHGGAHTVHAHSQDRGGVALGGKEREIQLMDKLGEGDGSQRTRFVSIRRESEGQGLGLRFVITGRIPSFDAHE